MSGTHANIWCLISDLFYELSITTICDNPKISHCYAFSHYWTSLYLFSHWFSQEFEMLQLSTAWFACFQHFRIGYQFHSQWSRYPTHTTQQSSTVKILTTLWLQPGTLRSLVWVPLAKTELWLYFQSLVQSL